MTIRRFKFVRFIIINGYYIVCYGFTGEIILSGVGSGHGAAVSGVVGMGYFGR